MEELTGSGQRIPLRPGIRFSREFAPFSAPLLPKAAQGKGTEGTGWGCKKEGFSPRGGKMRGLIPILPMGGESLLFQLLLECGKWEMPPSVG